MEANRRYSEEEIAQIFQRATEAQEHVGLAPVSGDGLTLAELQDIGREVGIAPGLITRAAITVRDSDLAATRTRAFLGAPVGVSRTVHLPRRLTDQEWARLVVDLRETFDARGELREQGPFRQWTNGNLHALLEPTESGEQLRLRTAKGGSRESLGMGAAMLVGVPVAWALAALAGIAGDPGLMAMSGVFAAVGGVLYGSSRIRLPKWAATRQRQMDAVAARLTAALEAADQGESAAED